MKYSFLIIFCTLALIFQSCFIPNKHQKEDMVRFGPIPYTFSNPSASFINKSTTLSVDTGRHVLQVTVNCHFKDKSAFPIDPRYHDTLTESAFLFEVFADGKPVLSSISGSNGNYWRYQYTDNTLDTLAFVSDTSSLANGGSFSVDIPFYAFHELRKGKHQFEIRISQSRFRSEHDVAVQVYDETFKHNTVRYQKSRVDKKLVYCSARFTLTVPPIYKTMLYSEKIVIHNDSVYNAYSSDNTLWKSSLPDVYWSVFYPQDQLYTSSDYQTSTTEYDAKDTFALYHYAMIDSVGFGVYDHDGLSRDDGLGFKNYCILDLAKRKSINAEFDYVKQFSIRIDAKGVGNN
ncbi:MAG: hypothetical protein JST26_15695 [Bacteroidetes bacterium]|nr:hypothetical protein [Bacteroidota bacterium]